MKYHDKICISRRDMDYSPAWLFDLNNTLHNTEASIFYIVSRAMAKYMTDRLKLFEGTASHLHQDHWHRYDAILAGLQIYHPEIDIDEFLCESHPLKQILAKMEGTGETDDVLGRLKGRKTVFSNGPPFYVRALVEVLSLEAHLGGLLGTDDLGLLYRPNPQAYLNVRRLLDVKPEQCIMVDNSVDNLHQAKALGMKATWYDEKVHPLPFTGDIVKDMQDLLKFYTKLPRNF